MSSSTGFSEWGEWAWSEQRRKWARFRVNHLNEEDWEFSDPVDVETPRSFANTVGNVGNAHVSFDPLNISTRDPGTRHESANAKYKIHKSKDFTFGRIFKILWSEPQGVGGTVITDSPNGHTKIRRFVIVDDSRKGHSLCLPILTYGGMGTKKNGCHPEDHAIIYTGNREPRMLQGEYGIVHPSILCKLTKPEEKLDRASRLNYTKVYTVEHNVKVYFIGQVDESYEQRVITTYNDTHPQLPNRPANPAASGYSYSAQPQPYTQADWNFANTSDAGPSSWGNQGGGDYDWTQHQ